MYLAEPFCVLLLLTIHHNEFLNLQIVGTWVLSHDQCGDETLTEITYLVLLAFYRPNHGYGVMQFLEEHTKGRVKPGAGTLYGAINSLV